MNDDAYVDAALDQLASVMSEDVDNATFDATVESAFRTPGVSDVLLRLASAKPRMA
jgi:hypothetical protein